jgi:hypothetical protein
MSSQEEDFLKIRTWINLLNANTQASPSLSLALFSRHPEVLVMSQGKSGLPKK